MKNKNLRLILFIILSFFYTFLAFNFKNFVISELINNTWLRNPLFDFYYVKNTGAAFSILEGNVILLSLIAFSVLLWAINYVKNNISGLRKIEFNAFAFLISGILSNLLERIIDGYVTDYFRLIFIDFPIFNLADIFINIGAFLFIYALLFKR